MTPRDDVDLELVSVEMSGGLTADQETYDRVTRDMERIRILSPETADVRYNGELDGVSVTLAIDDATAMAIDAGTYTAWDCLNDYYGLESVRRQSFVSIGEFAYLTLKGVYNTSLLGPLYEQLPGVRYAYGYGPGFHRERTICGLVDSAATRHYFIAVDAFGDCLSGCIYRDVRYFTSSGTGPWPRFRGRWANFEPEPPPPWADLFNECAYGPTHPLRAKIAVSPDPPVLGEPVVLTISGDDGNSACGPFFNHAEVDSVTRTIRVTADFNPRCGICSPEASPYSFDVDLGPLSGGEYQVMFFNGTVYPSPGGVCSYREDLYGLTQLVVGAPAAPIPALDPIGLGMLSTLVLGVALVILRKARMDGLRSGPGRAAFPHN